MNETKKQQKLIVIPTRNACLTGLHLLMTVDSIPRQRGLRKFLFMPVFVLRHMYMPTPKKIIITGFNVSYCLLVVFLNMRLEAKREKIAT